MANLPSRPPPLPLPLNSTRPSLVGKTLVNPSTYSGVEDEAVVVGSLLVYSRWLQEDRYSVRVISTWDYFRNSADGVIVGVKGSDLLPTLRKQVDNTTKFHAPIEYVFCGINPRIPFDENNTFRENVISNFCNILLFPVHLEANEMSLTLKLVEGHEAR